MCRQIRWQGGLIAVVFLNHPGGIQTSTDCSHGVPVTCDVPNIQRNVRHGDKDDIKNGDIWGVPHFQNRTYHLAMISDFVIFVQETSPGSSLHTFVSSMLMIILRLVCIYIYIYINIDAVQERLYSTAHLHGNIGDVYNFLYHNYINIVKILKYIAPIPSYTYNYDTL